MNRCAGPREMSAIVKSTAAAKLVCFAIAGSVAPAQAQLVTEPPAEKSKKPTGAFVMKKGKGVKVCEAYQRFLNASVDRVDSRLPEIRDRLMCFRSIPPEFVELAQPDWREIALSEVPPLAVNVELSMQVPPQGNSDADIQAVRKIALDTVLSKDQQMYRGLFTTSADFDNDGKPDFLVKYRFGRCIPDWPDAMRYRFPVVVIGGDNESVDMERSRQLLRLEKAFEVGGKKFTKSLTTPGSFDVFTFGGLTYVDRWDQESVDKNGKAIRSKALTIFLHRSSQSAEVCRFNYLPK